MGTRKITTLDGSSFLIAEDSGDFQGSREDVTGFFYKDTRHLSQWTLLINGAKPQVLSCDDIEYYFTQHFLAPRTGTIYENPYISVARRRMLGEGFCESLELMNHSQKAVQLTLEIRFDCDFADLFEVKDQLKKKGRLYQESRDAKTWALGYERESFKRETLIRCDFDCEFEPGRIQATFDLKAKETRMIEIKAIPVTNDKIARPKYSAHGPQKAKPNMRGSFADWITDAPKIECSINAVERVYRKSLVDLAALRFYPAPDLLPEAAVPSAGLPWFMALFGRDSIITSYQALPYVPDLAKTTLLTLARLQGSKVDEFRDEEPGKILHELRFGELTQFNERPQSPYFGSSDSTPLFLVLLDEYERWTGDRKLVQKLEPNARRALEWIDRYGDRDGDGYVEYLRGRETGLENQCWKDSWNSVMFSDGRVSEAPRALCEIQGYVYDAKVRAARLAREVWNDPKFGAMLEEQAQELKRRFNRDFWVESKEQYALALDKDKAQVDSLTSNIGHLLWSGIVPKDRAKIVAAQLLGPKLFSGWGVRTMGEGDAGYNPIEYHNGTVWPHDNSIIAAGLARYGFHKEANELILGMFSASIFFNFRLPEVFAGYLRSETEFPVEYPTASSPQAWATGAPLLGITVLLGLQAQRGQLIQDPQLPIEIGLLKLSGISGPWGKKDVEAINERALRRDEVARQWFERRAQALNKKMAG